MVNRIVLHNSHNDTSARRISTSEGPTALYALVILNDNYYRNQRIETLKIDLVRLIWYLPLLSRLFNLTALYDISVTVSWRFNVCHNLLLDTQMGLFVRAVKDPESLVKYAKCARRQRWSFSALNQRRQFALPVNDGLCFHTTSTHLVCMIYCNQRTAGLLLTKFEHFAPGRAKTNLSLSVSQIDRSKILQTSFSI